MLAKARLLETMTDDDGYYFNTYELDRPIPCDHGTGDPLTTTRLVAAVFPAHSSGGVPVSMVGPQRGSMGQTFTHRYLGVPMKLTDREALGRCGIKLVEKFEPVGELKPVRMVSDVDTGIGRVRGYQAEDGSPLVAVASEVVTGCTSLYAGEMPGSAPPLARIWEEGAFEEVLRAAGFVEVGQAGQDAESNGPAVAEAVGANAD
jgi:hypothetical protein